jgi:prefoldin subunit 5/DNA-directed RNA polymerase subunit RPC12/RpoP
MGYPKRTAVCKKCGSVEFKIVPECGRIRYICLGCKGIVANIYLDSYETADNKCRKCGNEIFKVEINEQGSNNYWSGFCIKCGQKIGKKYVDSHLNRIDRKTREMLIIQDRIGELDNKIEELKEDVEEKIDNLWDNINSVKYDLDDYLYKIKDVENKIEDYAYKIRDLDNRIDELDDKIDGLNENMRRISDDC